MALFSQSQLCLGAPDSVRCARLAQANLLLSGRNKRRTTIIHRTVFGEPTVAGPTVGRLIRARRVAESTARRGHRTVRCARTVSGAPTAPRCQRSASQNKERDPHRTVSGGAPDCPVRQSTEGKKCLPGMHLMAPCCLGAIKGTPRRMEEYTKHSQSIPKH
jgi:hypothetical protein